MKIKYCDRCGTKLIVTPLKSRFDPETGEQLYRVKVSCPNKRNVLDILHTDLILSSYDLPELFTKKDIEVYFNS